LSLSEHSVASKIMKRQKLIAIVAFLTGLLSFVPQACADNRSIYQVRYQAWRDDDERGYREFISALGESDCSTVDACLHSSANPFRASDAPGHVFRSDCAELPYLLRFYYAWKRGLPFSYVNAVRPLDGEDIRYSHAGNEVASRSDVSGGKLDGYAIMERIRGDVSSGNYRIHPDMESSVEPDFYSAALTASAVHPGTIIYDPAGHVATVYRVDPDGRVHFFDAHPDSSLTRLFYDLRFARAAPGVGAGFKNWRPLRLDGATAQSDGSWTGGHAVLPANKQISDYSDEQYYGTGEKPSDARWSDGKFSLNGEDLDYYDFVRARLAGGKLAFDPIKEVREMVESNCSDIGYREQAVDLAISAGIHRKAEPERLPSNIYGTSGEWEIYSTPSRDARLKTAFKSLRDMVERFTIMYERGGDPHLVYLGDDMVDDMLRAYDEAAGVCKLTYRRSDGSRIELSYEDVRQRLFRLSFDPYQCIERRWGATDANELSVCSDGAEKTDWYGAEQNLRNQIDRTYDARMDFTRDELKTPGAGKGVDKAPDTDARAYLVSVRGAAPGHAVVPVADARNAAE
jgi:hypothetical protein